MGSFHVEENWLMSQQQPVAELTPESVSGGPAKASSLSSLCLFDLFVHLRL